MSLIWRLVLANFLFETPWIKFCDCSLASNDGESVKAYQWSICTRQGSFKVLMLGNIRSTSYPLRLREILKRKRVKSEKDVLLHPRLLRLSHYHQQLRKISKKPIRKSIHARLLPLPIPRLKIPFFLIVRLRLLPCLLPRLSISLQLDKLNYRRVHSWVFVWRNKVEYWGSRNKKAEKIDRCTCASAYSRMCLIRGFRSTWTIDMKHIFYRSCISDRCSLLIFGLAWLRQCLSRLYSFHTR